jgi:phosphoglycolate phosphatase
MRGVELIIFDLDGTLVDSRTDIANAVNFTLRKLGLKEKSVAEISSYIGMGVEDLIWKSLGDEQDKLHKKALSVFEEYYRVHSTDNSVLYPGVKEILEYFQEKKKAVITNRNYEFAEVALKAFGINGYFVDILSGDDAGCMKPSPCPLDKCIDKLDVDKERAIIVGDMYIDILAGRRAGIITCAVTYGIGKKDDIVKAKPDYIIDNILQLKDIVN